MQRPVSYKDWRRLFHSVGKELGWEILFCWQKEEPLLNKRSWILLRRLERIWERLKLENEVMDHSWCEAMYETIFKK